MAILPDPLRDQNVPPSRGQDGRLGADTHRAEGSGLESPKSAADKAQIRPHLGAAECHSNTIPAAP